MASHSSGSVVPSTSCDHGVSESNSIGRYHTPFGTLCEWLGRQSCIWILNLHIMNTIPSIATLFAVQTFIDGLAQWLLGHSWAEHVRAHMADSPRHSTSSRRKFKDVKGGKSTWRDQKTRDGMLGEHVDWREKASIDSLMLKANQKPSRILRQLYIRVRVTDVVPHLAR